MADGISVRINSGADHDIGELADKWLAKAALQVMNEAKRIVPVDTGYLRSSIQAEHRDDGWYVGSSVVYAASIEFGHSSKAPQGYLRPALDTVMGRLGES